MTLLFLYLVVAIGCSFYCSIAEAVLLSISPSFIATMKKTRPSAAEKLNQLKSNVDRPLAAILSLNTIAHTIGAAGVGAQAVAVFGEPALGIASAVMTLLVLVFSEIIPKTIGALYWRPLGPIIATTVGWLIFILYPLVWMSEQLTKLISGGKSHHTLSREELAAMAHIGAQQGILEDSELRVFNSLIRFPTIQAKDIMTPRSVVLALDEKSTVEKVVNMEPVVLVSRIPVFQNSLDNVTGFVLKDDLLLAQAQGRGEQIVQEYCRDIIRIRDEIRLPQLLEQLLQDRQHIALVIDQYGGILGVVTLEDIIETLLDLEIVDEHDSEVDLQQYARDRWKKRAESLGIEVDAVQP